MFYSWAGPLRCTGGALAGATVERGEVLLRVPDRFTDARDMEGGFPQMSFATHWSDLGPVSGLGFGVLTPRAWIMLS